MPTHNSLVTCSGRIWITVLSVILVSCVEERADRAAAPDAGVLGMDEAAWTEELRLHRAEIDEDFKTSRTSPMAGTQYLKSEPGERYYLNREDREFHLSETETESSQLLVERHEGAWRWHPLSDSITCEVGGERSAPGSPIESSALFSVDELTVRFFPNDDQVTFIVFDPQRPAIQAFDHLLYFPPDQAYAVPARLVSLPEPEAREMPTTRGLIKTFYRYAEVEFAIGGNEQVLTAFKYGLEGDAAKGLFIPFKDATTGRETYGAGRYLQIDDPETDTFVLDFNRAFNPLCNYSPAYNCTLPPRENHLQVAIRAGEKTYPDSEGDH